MIRRYIFLWRGFLTILILFCLLAFAAGSFARQATDSEKMLSKVMRYADTSASSVSNFEYPKLASALTGYLDGKLDTPQVQVSKDGLSAPAFSDREILHLHDIRGLIVLANAIGAVAACLFLFGVLFYLLLKKKKPTLLISIKLRMAFIRALFFMMVCAFLAALWGLIDFEGLFVFFHQILFRNDLWLLDPQSDLLLQLMPLELFVSYALDILKQLALLLFLVFAAIMGLNRIKKVHP